MADQLWLMTCIREEEDCFDLNIPWVKMNLFAKFGPDWPNCSAAYKEHTDMHAHT